MAAFALLAVAAYAAIRVGLDAYAERRQSEIAVIGTLRVDYILGPTDAGRLGAAFGEDFAVTSSATIVVQNSGGLYEIAPSSSGFAFSAVALNGPAPDSFAVDSDDALLTVAGGYFGMLDADGRTVDAVPLPYDGMRLAHSTLDGVVYLFGGDKASYRLYRFTDDGVFQILLESDEPIVGVADNRKSVYVATRTQIVRLGAKRPVLVFKSGEADLGGAIVSLAVAPDDDVLFFSTSSRVYALRGAAALSVINDSGGALRLRGDALYVLDRARGLLYAARPATRKLFAEGTP